MSDDNGRSAAWMGVAVVTGGGAVPTWIEAVEPHAAFVPWLAAGSSLSLIAAFGIYKSFAWLSGRQKGLSKLTVGLEHEEWELWQGCIWIASLKIRITNVSPSQAIRLRRFDLESDPVSWLCKLTDEKAIAVTQEIVSRGESHGPHIRIMDLEPGDSMSGWYVNWVPLSPGGGRPECKFVATDAAGDSYELIIPARARKVHRIRANSEM